jgi:hypothetical protein
MNSNSQEVSISEVVSLLKSLVMKLLTRWKLLFSLGFIGGVLGFAYASIQSPTYLGRLSFMINENEVGIPSSLSSLAGLAGIGGAAGGSSDDKILFMANSRFILSSTLLNKALINGREDLLVNHYIDIYEMKDGFLADTALKGFSYVKNNKNSDLNYQENKVIDKIIGNIVEGKNLVITSKKKSGLVAQSAGIILFEFKSISEDLSYHFINSLYTELSSYYINKTVQRQSKNYSLIKHRADSLKMVLESREGDGAAFVDRNINPVKMQMRIMGERIRKDVEILNIMYAEVLKNLEIAKFTLESQTPSLTLIDSPTIPLQKKKLSRLKSAIVGAFLLGIFASIYIVMRYNRPELSNNNFGK